MAVATIVLVAIAVAVIVGVAISRRPMDQWQDHLRHQASQWTQLEDEGVPLDDVTPHRVSLSTMLRTHSEEGSAYVEAEKVPGYDRAERAAERMEELRSQRGKRGESTSSSSSPEGPPSTLPMPPAPPMSSAPTDPAPTEH